MSYKGILLNLYCVRDWSPYYIVESIFHVISFCIGILSWWYYWNFISGFIIGIQFWIYAMGVPFSIHHIISFQLSVFFPVLYTYVVGFLYRISMYYWFSKSSNYGILDFWSWLYGREMIWFARYSIIICFQVPKEVITSIGVISYQSKRGGTYKRKFIFLIFDNYGTVNSRYHNGCMLFLWQMTKSTRYWRIRYENQTLPVVYIEEEIHLVVDDVMTSPEY